MMDNLIADGKITPCLVVMNDGMISHRNVNEKGQFEELMQENGDGDAFEEVLLKNCIPFIEKEFRVLADREHRALAGLSMGSIQTCDCGIRHPEVFSYLGLFSGFLHLWKPFPHQDEWMQRIQNTDQFGRYFKVFFRAIGDKDPGMPYFLEDDETCRASGVDQMPNYHRVVYPNQFHEFGAWRRAFYDFVQLLFK